MNENELIKLLSTPGAVGAALVWLHLRTNRLEQRLELIASHLGAPRPVKIKYRGALLVILSVAVAAAGGCMAMHHFE